MKEEIMKKKILATMLALTMAISMTACGGSEPDTAPQDANETVSDVTEEDTTEVAEVPEEQEPEVPEEPAAPEVPEGYELYTLSDDTFGIDVTFPVKTGEDISETEDKITAYEDADHEGWYLSYSIFNVSPHSFEDNIYDYEKKNNEFFESDAGYEVVLSVDQEDWKILKIYGDDYLDGRIVAEIEIHGWQQRLSNEELLEEVGIVAKYAQISMNGNDQLYTADGKFQSCADYITIDPEITVDGQTLENGWICASAGYPYSGVEFTSSEGEKVSISEKGGYGGTIYAARVDDDDYTQVEIGGYPAIRSVRNAGGSMEAYYIILLGHDAKDYEENFEVYVSVEGDFDSSFLSDLLDGVSDSDLLDRMDSYLNDYMNSVTYTPSVTD